MQYGGRVATEPGLRERKKERTRRALVDAAADLFGRKGYEETTIAEIAAAADVATRTFFSYFASKEELLFADTDARLDLALTEIDRRTAGDRPADVLVRITRSLGDPDQQETIGLSSPIAAVRIRLVLTTPALQGYALRRLFSAQQEIVTHLHRAFADEFDEVTIAAMVGSFVGAMIGTVMVRIGGPAGVDEAMAHAPGQLVPSLTRGAQVAF